MENMNSNSWIEQLMCADFSGMTNTSHLSKLSTRALRRTQILLKSVPFRRYRTWVNMNYIWVDCFILLQQFYYVKQLRISSENFPPAFPERKAQIQLKYFKKVNGSLELLGILSVVINVEKKYKIKWKCLV